MTSRRTFLKAGAGVAVLGGAWLAKPQDNAGAVEPYFQGLSSALDKADITHPSLLIDLDKLDQNLAVLNAFFSRQPEKTYRIVVKSLPSPDLLDYIAERTQSHAYMVFHLPFLQALAKAKPDADILFGKPMPVASAAAFYQNWQALPQGFVPAQQLQWLIDSLPRLEQYLQLAKQQGLLLRVNFEIDVGLHRGGFNEPASFAKALELVAANPEHLQFSGLMGYDAHVSKLPGFLGDREFIQVQARYRAYVEQIRSAYPEWFERPLCFNGAGSPTFLRYGDVTQVNDLSVGSCLLKPLDFDLPILAEFEPAAAIATRVLKKQLNQGVPTQEWLGSVASWWDPNQQVSFFIYGGKWLAAPWSPPGLSFNSLYDSSNQQGLNGSAQLPLAVDDWVFLRPLQSEAVLLQFGHLLAMRNGQLLARWPVLGADGP
ncbi:alanine racemase [Bowmanella sp. Y26]|uniref:alanine racemase n=1 Tax=Bowmanella yangjiangensis TaxID=2811230 RepID=UPI001BDD8911|nr:alanine racemase [Bowmanella yangjiangensis]MBT1064456.1 alanine racemase [Bowmanella yangjiangensis]